MEDDPEEVVGLALEPVRAAPDVDDGRNAWTVGRNVRLDDHLVPSSEGEEVVTDLDSLDVVDGGDAAEVVEVEVGVVFGDAADLRDSFGGDGNRDLVDGGADLHGHVTVDGWQRLGESFAQAVKAGRRIGGSAASRSRRSVRSWTALILLRHRTGRPA